MRTEMPGYEKCHLIVTAHQNNCSKIVLESLWEIFRLDSSNVFDNGVVPERNLIKLLLYED